MNIIITAIYLIVSLLLFVAVLVIGIGLPPAFGYSVHFLIGLTPLGTGGWVVGEILLVLGGFYVSARMVVNIARSLRIAFSTPRVGLEVANPSILQLVADISRSLCVRPFQSVVFSEGLEVGTLYNSSGRVLLLSPTAIKYLTTSELKAIIAHECGHHDRGAMLIVRVHTRVERHYECFVAALRDTYWAAARVRDRYLGAGVAAEICAWPLFPLLAAIGRSWQEWDGSLPMQNSNTTATAWLQMYAVEM
ncbi:MAG TPA: M48 family metalloprotease [Gemmataceae bacterium]|nr:M48 family metalloprotease [Gemmataceae bacterium]